MIDTHAHIYLPEFDGDLREMIGRARATGVEKIFMPNIDSGSIEIMLAVQKVYPDLCFPMMGLHPCSVKENFEEELSLVEKYFSDGEIPFFGVGECGLDYYWDTTFVAQQKAAFEFQILLAKKYQLPVIIHSREATDDCIELIARHAAPELRGIFHCFSGTIEQLERVISLGFYAGIGGVVTFKNGGLDKILRAEHLPWLVLETDSPYLAPVPFRGKRNEPAYLDFVAKKLSEILDMEEEVIKKITSENAGKLFGH